ncbi:MAG: hypothetical protein WBD95_26730 [Xanthobacteraceae bacterium]
MSDDYKIYVDAGQPATLNNGAGVQTDCATLQEAVLAWHRLTPEQKIRATVKVIGGQVIGHMRLSGSITNRNQRDTPPQFPSPWSMRNARQPFFVKDKTEQALGSGGHDGRTVRHCALYRGSAI